MRRNDEMTIAANSDQINVAPGVWNIQQDDGATLRITRNDRRGQPTTWTFESLDWKEESQDLERKILVANSPKLTAPKGWSIPEILVEMQYRQRDDAQIVEAISVTKRGTGESRKYDRGRDEGTAHTYHLTGALLKHSLEAL